MKFDPILLAPRMAPMKAAGFWRDETIEHPLHRALQLCPDKTAVVSYAAGEDAPVRLSYRELDARVDRIARGLVSLGVGRSDVVTFQLPNCWEFIALSLACVRIGAVANPVMPIFRQHELNFMLNFGESKVFVVPKVFRGFDYEAMARGMLGGLPHLRQLVVLGGEGESGFEAALLRDDTPLLDGPGLGPDDVLLLMYTSGTTGEPKGVMHTSNTLFSNLHAYIAAMELGHDDVILGASPMAHLTGYAYLAMLPLILNATTVLQDIWEARRALQIACAEGVTFSMASTPFVADLCNAVEAGEPTTPRFNKFCCAGAPIPPVLIERAASILGMRLCSAWGMTENGAVTVTEPARAMDKSGVSDGRPLPGMELKVVDANGNSLPAGESGSLLVRGASLFGGYLKRPQLNATSADGWFDTGDVATIDAEGYIRITGRTKDVVIRGGENIPVVEIENLLYQHPAIAVVAIVGYPDRRLGERVCAFVSLKSGARFDFQEMVGYLEGRQVAKQYWPERLEIVEDLPRTPSGKLQKFKLRAIAKSFGDVE
ncbi:cyclohexanecarboxylate-CoA ligase [Zoogloea sp.]|uniref:cyclohexanecarboxylate-CoA ligase n=1 Tax=Zoogloea sp. TaxID=49181 RepID=UPI0025FC9E5B|nr:cyclohexanecarboxylate-CoA ligase [Zoogloea sp.]MCK6396413.1 cyclohexanecarboxylate-CoA ligase [Zoogloea sp.]